MEVLKENTVTVITVNVSMALEKRATRVDVGDITSRFEELYIKCSKS